MAILRFLRILKLPLGLAKPCLLPTVAAQLKSFFFSLSMDASIFSGFCTCILRFYSAAILGLDDSSPPRYCCCISRLSLILNTRPCFFSLVFFTCSFHSPRVHNNNNKMLKEEKRFGTVVKTWRVGEGGYQDYWCFRYIAEHSKAFGLQLVRNLKIWWEGKNKT